MRNILELEGVRIRLNATCITLAKRGSRIAVGIECEDDPPEVVGTHVLLAVGRTPNTHQTIGACQTESKPTPCLQIRR